MMRKLITVTVAAWMGLGAAGIASARPASAPPPPASLLQEMGKVIEAQSSTLAALETQWKNAPDEQAALVIQREIEKTKLETEIMLLEVQATHARREQRLAMAQDIDRIVRALSTLVESMVAPRSGEAHAGSAAPPAR